MLTCSVCNGPLCYLGTLGNVDHWRCRYCGSQESTLIDPDEENHDDDCLM